MTASEIAALPGSWYAAQPIPYRLARDIGYRTRYGYAHARPPRLVARQAGVFDLVPVLSPVERAHANEARRLVTAADGWVCPKCGRVWSPSTDRCKACRP